MNAAAKSKQAESEATSRPIFISNPVKGDWDNSQLMPNTL